MVGRPVLDPFPAAMAPILSLLSGEAGLLSLLRISFDNLAQQTSQGNGFKQPFI